MQDFGVSIGIKKFFFDSQFFGLHTEKTNTTIGFLEEHRSVFLVFQLKGAGRSSVDV